MAPFQISATLQSEMFSKAVTWELLTAKSKVAGKLEPCLNDLTVSVWPKVVYVHLTKNILRCDCPRGVSIFISYKEYLQKAIDRAFNRAREWEVTAETADTCTVRSPKHPNAERSLHLYSNQISCNCPGYRRLNNSIGTATPHLRALVRFHKVLGGQIPCPHAAAVLNFLGYQSFQDYFKERRDLEDQMI